MTVIEITGLITAVSTTFAAIISVIMILVNRKKAKIQINKTMLSFKEWFNSSKLQIDIIFRMSENNSVKDVFNESEKYKSTLYEKSEQLLSIDKKYGLYFGTKYNSNIHKLCVELRLYICLYDFFLNKLKIVAQDNPNRSWKDFKDELQELYPRNGSFTSDMDIGEYIFNLCSNIENEFDNLKIK